jgi:hypothetical protein
MVELRVSGVHACATNKGFAHVEINVPRFSSIITKYSCAVKLLFSCDFYSWPLYLSLVRFLISYFYSACTYFRTEFHTFVFPIVSSINRTAMQM